MLVLFSGGYSFAEGIGGNSCAWVSMGVTGDCGIMGSLGRCSGARAKVGSCSSIGVDA